MVRFGPILFHYSLDIFAQLNYLKVNRISRFQKPNNIKNFA